MFCHLVIGCFLITKLPFKTETTKSDTCTMNCMRMGLLIFNPFQLTCLDLLGRTNAQRCNSSNCVFKIYSACPQDSTYLVEAQATVTPPQSLLKGHVGTWIIGKQQIDARTMAFDRTTTILKSHFYT